MVLTAVSCSGHGADSCVLSWPWCWQLLSGVAGAEPRPGHRRDQENVDPLQQGGAPAALSRAGQRCSQDPPPPATPPRFTALSYSPLSYSPLSYSPLSYSPLSCRMLFLTPAEFCNASEWQQLKRRWNEVLNKTWSTKRRCWIRRDQLKKKCWIRRDKLKESVE